MKSSHTCKDFKAQTNTAHIRNDLLYRHDFTTLKFIVAYLPPIQEDIVR